MQQAELQTIQLLLEEKDLKLPFSFNKNEDPSNIANNLKQTIDKFLEDNNSKNLRAFRSKNQDEELNLDVLNNDEILEISRVIFHEAEIKVEDNEDGFDESEFDESPLKKNIGGSRYVGASRNAFNQSNEPKYPPLIESMNSITTQAAVQTPIKEKWQSSPRKNKMPSSLALLRGNYPTPLKYKTTTLQSATNSQELFSTISPSKQQSPQKTKAGRDMQSIFQKKTVEWVRHDIAITPIDGNDPDIYSQVNGVLPFSFMWGVPGADKIEKNCPPPCYQSLQILQEQKSFKKSDLLQPFEVTQYGDLKLVDKKILDSQKGIIGDILKKVFKRLAQGKSIFRIPLPVRIFEPESVFDAVGALWNYTPQFMPLAGLSKDPIERMKFVITTAIAGLHFPILKTREPFNNLWGETFEVTWPKAGVSMYMENTVHHPPINNFYIVHKLFKIYGHCCAAPGFEGGSFTLQFKGPNTVEFYDGQKIKFIWPSMKMSGLIWGDRLLNYLGRMKFEDEGNGIKAVIKFGESGDPNKKKRRDCFHGKLYYYDKSIQSKKKKNEKKDDLKFFDLKREISDIHGSFLENLMIGGEERWNIEKDVPEQFIPVANPLPTDVRFREDLIWVKKDKFEYAGEWKFKLEERQRKERKLRGKYDDDD